MGRGATVAAGNRWYQARIERAKVDDRYASRAGAAEMLGMSEDAVKSTELGLEKHMPVEKAVLMADAYNAPDLLHHYCMHECPIGLTMPLSDEVLSIEHITVKLIKSLRVDELSKIKDKLVDIAEDGEIADDELEDLKKIMDYLGKLSRTISELKILGEKITGEKR
jgi:hypothetical protein